MLCEYEHTISLLNGNKYNAKKTIHRTTYDRVNAVKSKQNICVRNTQTVPHSTAMNTHTHTWNTFLFCVDSLKVCTVVISRCVDYLWKYKLIEIAESSTISQVNFNWNYDQYSLIQCLTYEYVNKILCIRHIANDIVWLTDSKCIPIENLALNVYKMLYKCTFYNLNDNHFQLNAFVRSFVWFEILWLWYQIVPWI